MKRKVIYLFVALALLFSLIAVAGTGTVAAAGPWYVDGALGTDDGTHGTGTGALAFKTIQYAINDGRVVAGDTIIVAAGTYVENVSIPKSVTLKGAQYDVNVSGRTAANTSESTIRGLVTVDASGVNINGFTLTNPGLTNALSVTPSHSNIAITYNIVDSVGAVGLTDNVHAILLNQGPDSVTIAQNRFNNIKSNTKSVSAVGVLSSASTDSSTGLVIQDNTFTDIASASKGAYGIIINNAAGAPGAQIKDNTFSGLNGGWTHAIGLEGPTPNAIVTGNIFSGLTAGADNTAIFFEDNPNGGTVTVSGNQFNGTAFYGVAIHPKDLPGGTNNYNYTVTAEDNWWGSASGAKHSSNTFNVGSQGNAVSNNVDFVPWLNAASPGGARFAPVTTTDTVGSYASIQAGVTASNSGGTVNMAAGTYSEIVTVNQSLILRGANAGVSAGANPGTRVAESIINGGIKISASNVIIDGFQIQGGNLGSGDASCGIYILANYGGHTISNNKFPGPGTSITSRGILFGYTISGVTVKDNEISNWCSGVYINPSSNLLFDGNYIHGNTAGIGSDGISNMTVQNNNFAGNTEGWGAGTVGANVQGHNNNFVGNGAGINNYGGQVIDATNNWWGDPTGPEDLSDDTALGGWYNPLGQGDPVSDLVKYDPYIAQDPGVSGGGGCFIATAAYGSYLDSHVDTLRSFRDQYLETNPIGSAFVSLYYKVSPPMADFIEKHPTLKPIVRAELMPAVAMSSVALNTTLAEKAVILVAIALFAAALIMWLVRRTRRSDWGR